MVQEGCFVKVMVFKNYTFCFLHRSPKTGSVFRPSPREIALRDTECRQPAAIDVCQSDNCEPEFASSFFSWLHLRSDTLSLYGVMSHSRSLRSFDTRFLVHKGPWPPSLMPTGTDD